MEVRPNPGGGFSLFCDCCGREKLAEVRGDRLIIMDRRHGKKHIAVLPVADLSKLVAEGLTSAPDKV